MSSQNNEKSNSVDKSAESKPKNTKNPRATLWKDTPQGKAAIERCNKEKEAGTRRQREQEASEKAQQANNAGEKAPSAAVLAAIRRKEEEEFADSDM
jgi:hypothetical protein